jgi:decaprenyl-phosphate phosphoribosyltransferase
MGLGVLGAVLAFGFASSACYTVNDIRDREADRAHPRKSKRPIASGAVSVPAAWRFAGVLLVLAAACAGLAAVRIGPAGEWTLGNAPRWRWLLAAVAVYVANTTLYSVAMKHMVVLDVISLAAGFVLRVLGGCAAAAVVPSSFLLNVTFFVSMFLAFGKRLGERRTVPDAAAARAVQSAYTDDLLRMAVVVTGVATLVTYAGYVEKQGEGIFHQRFNLLWLTMLPATYGLLRCIVLLERGDFDDPTEIAAEDRAIQAAAGVFALMTLWAMGAR